MSGSSARVCERIGVGLWICKTLVCARFEYDNWWGFRAGSCREGITPMYSWKWIAFALCLVSVPLRAAADPPEHAAKKKPQPDVLMARHADSPAAEQAANKEAGEVPGHVRAAAARDALEGAPKEGAEAPQPQAAAARGRGPESHALESTREGLRVGQGNLNVATQRLEQSATLRERAEQARSRAWTRWKAKLLTEDAIDPRVQRELEKHARREAKLQRLGALAQQAGDTQALERLAKLQALEASLHEKHMQVLMAKSQREKEPAQP